SGTPRTKVRGSFLPRKSPSAITIKNFQWCRKFILSYTVKNNISHNTINNLGGSLHSSPV
ncbi:MAG: hypothetical protein ABIH18_01610, partial [Candidatus Omnitrophota bacterium]